MLYIYTVFCTVYRIFRDGQRMPPDVIEAGGVDGWLTLANRGPMSSPELFARLFKAEGLHRAGIDEILPVLKLPTLKRIDKGGMMLSGLEDGPRYGQMSPQKWWVVPQLPT